MLKIGHCFQQKTEQSQNYLPQSDVLTTKNFSLAILMLVRNGTLRVTSDFLEFSLRSYRDTLKNIKANNICYLVFELYVFYQVQTHGIP